MALGTGMGVRLGRHGRVGLALLLALVLAIVGTTTPWPVPADAPAGRFAAGRAMADVRIIAVRPHPAGSAADAALRQWLAGRLTGLGMQVRQARFTPDAALVARNIAWGGPADRPRVMVNLVAVLPGRDRTLPAVALMAHHDSVDGSPGAADDGAGLSAILEVVRAVRTQGTPPRDLMVILTDGEEIGLDGARAFFGWGPGPADPWRDHVGALINLEARGGGGRATLFQTTPGNGAAIALASAAIHHPAGSSLAVYLYNLLPNDTDLTMALPWARAKGVAGYNFAFIGRPALYHSPLATPDRLDQGALQDIGSQVLDLTGALLAQPTLPGPGQDAVFFDLYGLVMPAWPAVAGWAMLGASLVAMVVLVRPRGGQVGWIRTLRRTALSGAARITGLAGLGALLTMGANLVSFHVGRPNYYDRLAATPRLEVMAAASAFAAFFIVVGRWRAGRGALAGAFVPLWLVGLALQVMAPSAAYVVIVPVLIAAIIALLPLESWPGSALAVLLAALVLGYQLQLAHEVLQAVGSDMPLAVALPLVLGTLAVLPLWQPLSHGSRRLAVTGFVLLAFAVALTIRAAPIAATVPAYSLTDHPAP